MFPIPFLKFPFSHINQRSVNIEKKIIFSLSILLNLHDIFIKQ